MALKKFYHLVLLVLLCFAATACGDDEDDDSSELDSVVEAPDDDASATEAVFYVDVASSGWTNRMHKDSGVNEACEVTFDATAPADKYINCLLEVPEASAHHRDIPLKINVPPQMCRYVTFETYHFYNWPLGTGPTEIWVQTNTDDQGAFLSYSCSEVSGNQVDMGACSFTEWTLDNGSPLCVYNHNAANSSHPNCCIGPSVVRTQKWDVVNLALSDVTSTNTSWGAAYDSQCIGGPAKTMDDWPGGFDTQNFPGMVVYPTWLNGLNETYDFKRPNSLARDGATNVHLYNYYAGVTPNQLSPTHTDLSGDAIRDVQENYEINCLDENFEVLRSIDIKFREWNTLVEFDNLLAGGLADPDVTGLEGVNCDYDSPISLDCNDYWDWDDLVGGGNLFPALLWEGVSASSFEP